MAREALMPMAIAAPTPNARILAWTFFPGRIVEKIVIGLPDRLAMVGPIRQIFIIIVQATAVRYFPVITVGLMVRIRLPILIVHIDIYLFLSQPEEIHITTHDRFYGLVPMVRDHKEPLLIRPHANFLF